MNKELALIYEYAKAPQELKDAASVAKKASAKLTNKTAQKVALDAEIKVLIETFDKAYKEFQTRLSNWNPVEGD